MACGRAAFGTLKSQFRQNFKKPYVRYESKGGEQIYRSGRVACRPVNLPLEYVANDPKFIFSQLGQLVPPHHSNFIPCMSSMRHMNPHPPKYSATASIISLRPFLRSR